MNRLFKILLVKKFIDKFTELVVTLILSRDISNKLAGVYIPTALIVLVCLSTFWYGPGSITDRITVGTTALLALITQFIDTRKYLPPISYISVRMLKKYMQTKITYKTKSPIFLIQRKLTFG